MAVILDTAEHRPSDRVDLVHAEIARAGVPTDVTVNGLPAEAQLRIEGWRLGAQEVLRITGTGLRLRRTERHLRGGVPELFTVTLSLGDCIHTACQVTQHYRRDDCHLNDLTGATDIAHVGALGGSFIVHVRCDDVGLPVDAVRAALPRLRASPVYPVMQGHLRHLAAGIEDLTADPLVSASVGAATVELTCALVVSAAGHRRQRDVLHETLRSQVEAYIRQHLRDPGLTVARIADAHHVSRRTLYKIWGNDEPPLREWITRERVRGAARDLRNVACECSSIATVARGWGFSDPTHFGRRFRDVHGMSPSEWRSESG